MEAAPLTLAHNHARNAVLETRRSNPVAASEEHDLAAAEFATAAQGTRDSEALRILTLLEQHHKKLGWILKSRHEKPSITVEAEAETGEEDVTKETKPKGILPAVKAHEAAVAAEAAASQKPPRLPRPARATARDLSSSIASNLASARGIPRERQRPAPLSPSVSNQSAGGKFTQEQDKTQPASPNAIGRKARNTSKPSWAPPDLSRANSAQDQAAETDAKTTKLSSSDAPFQQFYATFESLISKISAPLAFAGLPLTNTINGTQSPISPAHPATTAKGKLSQPTSTYVTPMGSSIDYSQLINAAALRAVADADPSKFPKNPDQSFYLVPTSGGTMSYAEIMSRAEKENSRHNRSLSGITEDNNSNSNSNDFVDARSKILAYEKEKGLDSEGHHLKAGKGGASNVRNINNKTMEELTLENQALKHLSDTLSKRLHLFEISAQASSNALAQSIRSLPRSPIATPENSRGKVSSREPSDLAAKARITELEEVLRKHDKELARRREENGKLKEVITRYREKWEKLKEGARARRETGGGTRSPLDAEAGLGGISEDVEV